MSNTIKLPGNTPGNTPGDTPATLQQKLELLKASVRYLRHAHRHFRKVEKICLFIGESRTGSTLLGALLNAHPEIVIAHEYNICKVLINKSKTDNKYKVFRNLLVIHSLSNMRWDTLYRNTEGLTQAERRYVVEGMCQCDISNPRVLGDKDAVQVARVVRRFGAEKMEALFRGLRPIYFICPIRNPYDAIATNYGNYANMAKWMFKPPNLLSTWRSVPPQWKESEDPMAELIERGESELRQGKPLMQLVAYFFAMMEGVLLAREHSEKHSEKYKASRFLDVHYMHVTQRPIDEIKRAVHWLGLECSEDYLSACARLVGPMSRTRDRIAHLFTDDVRALIDEQIQRFDFLHGYGWDTDEPRQSDRAA